MAKGITKNQHYVPRCVLKQFTTNENKTHINKFCFSDKSVDGKNIEKVCALKYFYGKQQDIEQLYGLSEDDMAKILDEKLTKGNTTLSKEEFVHIKAFIGAQSTRTLSDTQTFKDLCKGTIDSILKLNGVDNIPEYSVDIPDRTIKIQNLRMGLIKIGSFINMDFVLLKAPPFSQFLIGQDPVIEFNPFLWKREKINNKGLAYYGYTILMPISSRYCLCLYDPGVYKKIGKEKIKTLTYSQTKELNLFQFLNSDEYVLFEKIRKCYLKRLLKLSKRYKKENQVTSTIENTKIHNSIVNTNKVPLTSCFKITEKAERLNTKILDTCIRPEVNESEQLWESKINEQIELKKKDKGSI